jgi:hypothetical protein
MAQVRGRAVAGTGNYWNKSKQPTSNERKTMYHILSFNGEGIRGLVTLADQLELRLAKARRQVAAFTPSLLAFAFAGKLISQNPDDEPAEQLLERIAGNNSA